MTPAKWRGSVRARLGDYCLATYHVADCNGLGAHIHHMKYKSLIPSFTHYSVIANGIPLSLSCHDEAHRTHNGNIDPAFVRIAESAIQDAIAKSDKRFLKVKIA